MDEGWCGRWVGRNPDFWQSLKALPIHRAPMGLFLLSTLRSTLFSFVRAEKCRWAILSLGLRGMVYYKLKVFTYF